MTASAPESAHQTARLRDAGPARPDRSLAVAQVVTTLAWGGAQATVVASGQMADHGVEVTVLAGRDVTDEGTFWGDPLLQGARVVPVPALVRRPAPVADLRALVWLVRWLRTNRPDVVHSHSFKAGLLARIAGAVVGIPRAHTVHGWGPLHHSQPSVRRLAVLIERLLARLTTVLVVVGARDRETGVAAGIGRAADYRVIRSGVETTAASTDSGTRERIRAELGLSDRFVVGMVARLSHPKDQATLVAAFALAAIGESTLVLVGDGPDRARLTRLVRDLDPQLDVRFLGQRPDADRIVAGFDVAVLSSRWEGMPRSVVEAAAAGVPVVTTAVGSVDELIEPGVSGTVVPVGDRAAMAGAIVELYTHPERARAMAEVAQRRAAEFSAARMRAQLAALWRELSTRSVDAPVGR